MSKQKKAMMQLIGIEVFRPGSGLGIEMSYLIDGAQKTIHVEGTTHSNVSLVTGDDWDGFNDLAGSALSLIHSIADKWEKFRDDAVYERNALHNRDHSRSREGNLDV